MPEVELKPIFDLSKLRNIPWWFRFIGWALPSSIGFDGKTWVEVKSFRGKFYITRYGTGGQNARTHDAGDVN